MKNDLFFLRHGKTNYTGVFPDLSDEGRQEIGKAADYIDKFIWRRDANDDMDDMRIVSSPAPRALGTADIIAKRIGHPYQVLLEPAIRCMDFYNINMANAIWKSFPTARDVDCAYAENPLFDEGVAIEKRSAIQQRFYRYLGSLFERFAIGNLPDVMVHTSHYEVLWNLAALFGFEDPLSHGEVIRLELTSAVADTVHVRATFREISMEFDSQLLIDRLRNQFGK